MITNTLEFPCIEAARCHLSEKEYGLRLTLKKKSLHSKDQEVSYQPVFTEKRDRNTEWYVRFDTATTSEGITRRCVTFQHVGTGKYLHCSSQDSGTIETHNSTSECTSWLMEPVQPKASLPVPHSPQGGPSPDKRTYHDGMELIRSRTLSWESVGSLSGLEPEPLSVQYHLLPKGMESRKLACKRQDLHKGGLVLTTTVDDEAAVWELEFTSGELCFIRNPAFNGQIRCDMFGKLTISAVFQGWEVFRFIEVGHGQVAISSWTHTQKYLSCDPDGRVSTSENRLGHWEKWRLEKTSQHGVHIISVAHPDRYLCIGRDEAVPLQTTTKPNDFSLWHLDAAHISTYYLSSIGSDNKLQLSSQRDGPFLSRHRRDWEEWRLEPTLTGDFSFFSKAHQKYLGCNSHGDVLTTSQKGEWSLWEIEESPHGGIFLRSKAHHRYISVEKDRLCTTEDSYGKAESFRLEPWLPVTISGPRLAALGLAGAVGVALTIAMPYAVLGVMEVAVLSAEALIGVGGGALLGAGVLGTTAAVVKDEVEGRDLSPTTEVKDDYLMGSQRPICAWRDW